MTHSHLCFDFSLCFDYNAYKDEEAGAAECDIGKVRIKETNNERQTSNYTKEDSTDKCYSAEDLCNVICCRLTGTNTGDKAAVLLKVICNFYGIEGNCKLEVSKSDNKNKVNNHINPAGH